NRAGSLQNLVNLIRNGRGGHRNPLSEGAHSARCAGKYFYSRTPSYSDFLVGSDFCLNILSASFRMVSETSLFPDKFFKSAVSRFFIRPRETSSGVLGLATRFRTTA